MPKISVVMPVYNTKEEYLREAIESILNQTYSDFEFLIMDDSTQDTAKNMILAHSDKRIKYIKNEKKLGLAKTRSKLLKKAQGEYVAVMDSDDISLPERFQKQVKFLDENPEISILGTWFEFFPETKIIKHPKTPKYLDILRGCFIGHPTVMLRKKDFEKYDLNYNENCKGAEDYELWSRAIRYLKFYNLPEILLKYRWFGENTSIKEKNAIEEQNKITRQNMFDFLCDDKKLQKEIMNSILHGAHTKLTFLQQIFSIVNEENLKIMRILGIKILIRKKEQ